VTDALALGEKLLSLLDESARTTTYKPALLLALIDRAQEHVDQPRVPVRILAERVIELYWPQTLPYQTTGKVLNQSQTRGRATIVADIESLRRQHGTTARALPETARSGVAWTALVDRVEETLAEWPIPRLQHPFAPFLYEFSWDWKESGGWSARRYRAGGRAITLFPGVGDGLTALGPLLRPFITRWWTEKAAQLNPDVEDARSMLEFEDFLFGRDRVALERVTEGLLALQHCRCFYCNVSIARRREIDHFVPWAYSGDDGLDNLVAACHRCNNSKRATLAGPNHLAAPLQRNERWDVDLATLADERRWPRDRLRSLRIARAAYLRSPDERPLWIHTQFDSRFHSLGPYRSELSRLLQ
jgi:hypothetical protein